MVQRLTYRRRWVCYGGWKQARGRTVRAGADCSPYTAPMKQASLPQQEQQDQDCEDPWCVHALGAGSSSCVCLAHSLLLNRQLRAQLGALVYV
eukprot:1140215-Pelagomonas_calceolata.AAC.1